MKELNITKEDPCDWCIVSPMCKKICILKNTHVSYIHLIQSKNFIKVMYSQSKTKIDYHFISVIMAGATYSSWNYIKL